MTSALSTRIAASLGLGIIFLASCSRVPQSTTVESQAIEPSPAAMDSAPVEPPIDAVAVAAETARTLDASAPAATPQLVKQASLTLRVDTVEERLDDLGTITRAQQGDILTLEGRGGSRNQNAMVRLRVPQERLDATLEAIAELGQVTQRRISAEDVSAQMVDLEARLRNLRKTEEMLLGIMERSGEVGEVLQVAQEISQVRSSIEQLDAQRQQLGNQVRYSTITVTLSPAIAASPIAPITIRDELGQTWQQATLSFRHASVGLMKLLLWLLVYSPYIGIVVLIGLGYYLRRTRASRA